MLTRKLRMLNHPMQSVSYQLKEASMVTSTCTSILLEPSTQIRPLMLTKSFLIRDCILVKIDSEIKTPKLIWISSHQILN